MARATTRSLALLAVVLAPLAVAGSAAAGTAPLARAATGGCQAIGGGKVASSGPDRATVVIDTGSGPVWSACISFSGTVTGTAALQLAKATITDLDPVYEIYGGEGAAICVLRGVGNQPPDCLSQTIEYWKYFRNGGYAAGGAGRATVHDGDVEAWRWGGSGATPRPATVGSRAVAATPAPTTTTTTAPPTPPTPPTTRPASVPSTGGNGTGSSGTTLADGSSGSSGSTGAGAGPVAEGTPGGGSASTSAPAGSTATTTAPGGQHTDGPAGDDVSAQDASGGDDGADAGDEIAAAPAAASAASGGSSGGGASGLGTVAGLAGALAVVLGLGALARRRRAAVPV